MAGKQIIDREVVLLEILPRLSKGEPLARILDADGMPDLMTVYYWMRSEPAIFERITQARENGGDHIANECLTIADEKPADMVAVQHQKLRVETRLKLLSKWHPKRYGDKLELSGEITVTESPLAQLRAIVQTRQASQGLTMEAETVDMVEGRETGEADCF